MMRRRRWFQYSLRSFLVLLTVLAVWLGVVVHRAREQREAVKAIEAMGGTVIYDWELERLCAHKSTSTRSMWLKVYDNLFAEVFSVDFDAEGDCLVAVSHLRRLRDEPFVTFHTSEPKGARARLAAILPNCTVLPLPSDGRLSGTPDNEM